jgi:hypothetical protein
MTSTPKIKGIAFEFANGETLVVPPLNLASIELLQDRLANFKGGLDKESISLVIDAAHMALKRNYPDITVEAIKNDLVDLSNMESVMGMVMDVSGLKRKEIEQGEAKARK